MSTDKIICFLAAFYLFGLLGCRAEQPEVQAVVRPTGTATAVSSPTAISTPPVGPTQPPPTPTISVTLTPPTATPFLLPTRPTVRDYITESDISTAGLTPDVLEQRIIAFEPLNSERSFLMDYFVDTPDDELNDELHFLRFDKATQTWFATDLQEPERPEGEAWCRENNHHCDAELFNNYISSDVVVNDDTDSLAFVVTFAGELIVDLPEEEAVYFYRGVHNGDLEFREVSEAELSQLFGEYELADLLEADRLERIFTEIAFIEEQPTD